MSMMDEVRGSLTNFHIIFEGEDYLADFFDDDPFTMRDALSFPHIYWLPHQESGMMSQAATFSICAMRRGVICGSALVDISSLHDDVHISKIFVSPSVRKERIGTGLIQQVIRTSEFLVKSGRMKKPVIDLFPVSQGGLFMQRVLG